jgi:taurine--2-oxoglutarate transaminase
VGKKEMAEELMDKSLQYNFFSWTVQSKAKPIALAGGEGCYFWDVEGNRYLDFISQLMCTNAGHQHPKIVSAIKEQADQLYFAAPKFTTQVRSELAELLAEVTPDNLTKVLFTLGGSESNENAIKFVRHYTGKFKIIARYRAYHGATHGAMSLSGDIRRTKIEPGIPGVVHVPDPYCYRCSFNQQRETCNLECVSYIEEVIHYEDPERIAAIFMEGVTGSNGIFVPRDDYWPAVRALCDKYNILLVSDEVMSGFGRTGEWFAVDNWGVKPDIITMAKGLTGSALPLGAVAVSSEIAEYFWDRTLWMGLTYNGHPMSCAAGLAAVKVYQDEGLIENCRKMGQIMTAELRKMQDKHPSIGEFRSIGLFGVIELVKDRGTKEPIVDWMAGETELMNELYQKLMKRGVYTFLTRNWLFMAPPLIVTEKELMEGLDAIDEVLTIADKAVR